MEQRQRQKYDDPMKLLPAFYSPDSIPPWATYLYLASYVSMALGCIERDSSLYTNIPQSMQAQESRSMLSLCSLMTTALKPLTLLRLSVRGLLPSKSSRGTFLLSAGALPEDRAGNLSPLFVTDYDGLAKTV